MELSGEKKLGVINQIRVVKEAKECKIRNFAAFIDTVGSCFSTFKYRQVHLRNFEY